MTTPVPPFFPPTGQEIVLILLGVVAIGSALLVVTTRQLVHAALWLVLSFGALAGCYIVLTAEFVAWVQVLIYVGAVIVLLLFGIMLTRAPIGRTADLDSGNRKVAVVVALATAGVLVTVVIDGFRNAYTPLTPGAGAAKELGTSIFRNWVLPFEALSVLLLAALIGAIVLSRTDIRPSDGGPRSGNGLRPGDGQGPGDKRSIGEPLSGQQRSGERSGSRRSSETLASDRPSAGGLASGQPGAEGLSSGQPVGEQVSGEQTSGESASSEQASGEPARGEQASGEPASAEPVSGEPVRGEPASGGDLGGERSSGRQASEGSSSSRQWGDGSPSDERLSGEQKSGRGSSGSPALGDPAERTPAVPGTDDGPLPGHRTPPNGESGGK